MDEQKCVAGVVDPRKMVRASRHRREYPSSQFDRSMEPEIGRAARFHPLTKHDTMLENITCRSTSRLVLVRTLASTTASGQSSCTLPLGGGEPSSGLA